MSKFSLLNGVYATNAEINETATYVTQRARRHQCFVQVLTRSIQQTLYRHLPAEALSCFSCGEMDARFHRMLLRNSSFLLFLARGLNARFHVLLQPTSERCAQLSLCAWQMKLSGRCEGFVNNRQSSGTPNSE